MTFRVGILVAMLATLLVGAPLRFGSAACCCDGGEPGACAIEQPVEGDRGCCPAEQERPDRPERRDGKPCDGGCECPLRCAFGPAPAIAADEHGVPASTALPARRIAPALEALRGFDAAMGLLKPPRF